MIVTFPVMDFKRNWLGGNPGGSRRIVMDVRSEISSGCRRLVNVGFPGLPRTNDPSGRRGRRAAAVSGARAGTARRGIRIVAVRDMGCSFSMIVKTPSGALFACLNINPPRHRFPREY